MSSITTARGRVAALSRSRTADDPELIAAQQSLKAANTEAWIKKQLDSAPPLTLAQREKLGHLLIPAATNGGGSR